MTIDVWSGGAYPANVLSNFHPNDFVFDGVKCSSMEGLLQSLKTKNVSLQKIVCSCSDRKAKFFFRHKIQNIRWKLTGKLYWKGKSINRHGDEYQCFLDAVYDSMCNNDTFRDALINSNGAELTHKLGGKDTRKTILTEYEFVSRLMRCREKVVNQRENNLP